MKTKISFLLVMVFLISCGKQGRKHITENSPDGKVKVNFTIKKGTSTYSVSFGKEEIIEPSRLGIDFKNAESFGDNLKVENVKRSSHNSTWSPIWGAASTVRNNYNELIVEIEEREKPFRKIKVIFRIYNDGVGFRYIFPEQKNMDEFQLTSENTEFKMAADYKTWWQIANYDSYEYTFAETPVSELGDEEYMDEVEYGWEAFGDSIPGAANTPVTMKTEDGIYLSIHEAALTDYAGMTLEKMKGKEYTLKSTLAPWPDGEVKVKAKTPHKSPWRTIQIGESAGDLIESKLIVNLNEPNKLENTDWINPAKYCGIWWSLHIGKESWGTGPDHGAYTENVKRYMDFAAENDIEHVLVEGWNKYGPLGNRDTIPDYITPTDDLNLSHVLDYAEDKGVKFKAYNETACQVENYRQAWDTTFSYYQKNGIDAIKVGHVNDLLEDKYHHHSQWGVNYYQDLIETTAEYNIHLAVHEPVKPTGKRRTYPHYMTREGVAGMEQDKFDYADPREHSVEVPFIRMLAGPVDYMPGIFDNKLEDYEGKQVQTTVARQLAFYPVFLSGLQSVTDLPENYEGKPAFQFIKDVPVTWDETQVIKGKIGDYLSIARRKGEEWFIGSITDDEPRTIQIPLEFLEEGEYKATIYSDGGNAHAVKNPDPVDIEEVTVTNTDTLTAEMANGGGQAVQIVPAD